MIYLYYGSNEYALHRAVAHHARQAKDAHGEHALERLDGETLQPERLPDVLQAASLFTPERTVIIRDASLNKPLWEALDERLEHVPASLRLVLAERAPDKRTKTFKTLQKRAEVHECKELNEADAAAWLVAEAGARGGRIKPAEAAALVARAGAGQLRLSGELDKLLLFGDTGAAAIERLVEPTPQANVFGLLDAVLQRQPAALQKLLDAARTREDPYMIFGLLSAQMLQLAALVHAGPRTSEQVAKALGSHPYPLKKLQPLVRHMAPSELRLLVARIARLDDQLKSARLDPWLLLERALIEIAAR